MIPAVGEKWKPIEGTIVGIIKDVSHGTVTIEANEGRIVHAICYGRFCEYWERVKEEATAPPQI